MDKKGCKGWAWQHFSKVNERATIVIICNYCKKIYSNGANIYSMKSHLNNDHNIHNNEDYSKWKDDTNGVIWQYFSKQENYFEQCNFAYCKVSIPHAYAKTNLTRHLKVNHEHIVKTIREEIANTWLSLHFKFMGCYAYCRIETHASCKKKINIFCENDLKFHLDKYHYIREERTNDINADEMIQQSVDETNNAGPSSHHDITPKQPLDGNQEGHQGIHDNEDNLRWKNEDVIWQYFSKDGSKAQGKVCGCNVNISCGIKVLISHFECHYINKNLRYRKEIGDNAYGIAGQSEENNAGPSSQHDNAPKQPLGNQDGQQGRQQGSESTDKIWKPYM